MSGGSTMKKSLIGLLALAVFFSRDVLAHPGSGIVVDRQGNIYFVDTGSGLWKIDPLGKLTRLSAPAYHWMAIDIDSRLAAVRLPYFPQGQATVARDSGDSRILVSSDFPIAVAPDGALYYPWLGPAERVQIFRLAPAGAATVFKTLPSRTERGPLRWLNGIAAATDGSIYFTEDTAIRRITPQGELTTVVSELRLSDCSPTPGVGPELGPYFRGLDIDKQGNVYVAATGCGVVLKIAADRRVSSVLRTMSPWSPTAVAISGSDLYVLEYLHKPTDDRRDWLPRVRKVSSDGRVVTLASIDRR
jgi:sugar lactone lactonase YvrE